MAVNNPTWDEVFERAFVLALGRHSGVKVTAEDLIRTVHAAAPLHGIPTGYNRKSDQYKNERAQKWLNEKSSKVKLTLHSHLEKVFVVERGPSSTVYDTCFGAWHLCGSDQGGLAWQRLETPNGRVALQCVINNEEALIQALLSFAIQTGCALTVPTPEAPYRGPKQQNRLIYNDPNRMILTSMSEGRFKKGGEVRYVTGLPPGVALLFLNDPENTGLMLIDEGEHGRRSYGMVAIPGSIYALQLAEPGFEPLEKVSRVGM